ncbi:MATE family efflux transporter [Eubacterium ventriosum]|uniref:MATE family efflux transporter n=1 Tax=Eubacterium ventriosum TaxID=39496 RepID=UPI001C02CE2B|nr:MATE family efflux transporter [Eubacterium ventriosum]MBT9697824.1 MATE family efflux transporter [Eubacterium ventriosum]
MNESVLSFKNKYFGDKNFYKMTLTIAIPIIIQNLLTNLVSMADNIMVGQLGTNQMSGVAIINQLFFVFNLLVFGGMSGAGLFSAQYFGQKNHNGVRDVFRMKILIGIAIIAISLSVMIFLHEPLINMFLHEGSSSGNIQETFNYAKNYLYIMVIGIAPFVISNCYNTTLKESGQTVVPMKAGVLAVVFDIVLNYIFIFGKLGFPAMGVVGAAIATVISRFVECGYLVIYTHRHSNDYPFIKHCYRTLKVPGSLVKKIIVTGTPLMLNEFLWAGGLTLQTQALSTKGLATVGGLNICNTIGNISNCIFVTMGTTIAIVVGQLLGAGKLKEAKVTATRMAAFSLLISFGMIIILGLLGPVFPHFYNTTDEIRELATKFIWAVAAATPFISLSNSEYFILRSGGKTIITFLFDSCFVCLVNVPVAICLTKFTAIHIVGIFFLVNMLECIKALIGFIMVKKDIWLNTIVD